MARNIVYKHALNISRPVPTGTRSGDPVRIGVLNGVATTDEGSLAVAGEAMSNGNEPGFASVTSEGIAKLPISGTDTGDIGDPVYIDDNSNYTDGSDGEPPFVLSLSGTDLFGSLAGPKGATDGELVEVDILKIGA